MVALLVIAGAATAGWMWGGFPGARTLIAVVAIAGILSVLPVVVARWTRRRGIAGKDDRPSRS